MSRDPVADQLKSFAAGHKEKGTLTTSTGCPIATKTTEMTVGPRGPLLMQDLVFLNEMAHFDRERIPERVVHAKGAGAHGYLECTNDITKFTKLAPFAKVGTKTPMFARFSTVGGESGSADTARDPRGFALKFYTTEGNWDLVGNNTPIFFIRDAFQFPSFIHTQKRNPVTHCKDPDMFWDFISLRPETTHQVMFLFSDRGTPDGYRHMSGFGSHTYKMVNAKGEAIWCKFHFKPVGGNKTLSAAEAHRLSADDPDYAIRDLFNAIASGNFPTWKLSIQVMTLEEANKVPFNPFDVTKIWPHAQFPLIEAGKMVLDRNPADYFAEVEQSAFSPASMIPGIEPSPDKLLQGRLFSYDDTHYHRLGVNFRQLPINCPYRCSNNALTQRDGPHAVPPKERIGHPNYHPNSFNGPTECAAAMEHSLTLNNATVERYDNFDDDNFSQPRVFWEKVLNDTTRKNLVDNIAGHLCNAQKFIQDRAIGNFTQVHADFGKMLRTEVDKKCAK